MEGPKTRSDRDLRRGPVGARIGHARFASGLARNRHRPLTCVFDVERVTGIEPAWPAWKAGALPLSYTRKVRGSA